jgi:hypothetical protein
MRDPLDFGRGMIAIITAPTQLHHEDRVQIHDDAHRIPTRDGPPRQRWRIALAGRAKHAYNRVSKAGLIMSGLETQWLSTS